jgi:acyl carrier protein
MSLDTVELIMEIEDAFEIRITENSSEKMETVGDVYQYVLDQQKNQLGQQPAVCLTAVTFYKLRRMLTAELGLDRGQLRPDSSTYAILPTENRGQQWARLEKALQLKLPELAMSPLLGNLCWIGPVLAGILLALLMLPPFPLPAAVLAGGIGCLILLITCYGIAESHATLPAPAFATLGDLAKVVLADNVTTIRRQYAAPNRSDTWEVLQAIIVKQLGVDPKDVTPEASFVYDLGIG